MQEKVQWIIELDYDADPEVDRLSAEQRLGEEVSKFRSPFEFYSDDDLDCIICEADDAMTIKFQFPETIVRMERLDV